MAESIAKDYTYKNDSKINNLRKLDNKAKLPANVFAYTFGILSSLIVGIGMCLGMQVIGNGLVGMISGVIVGTIGFACCGINYYCYKKLLEKGKAKYANEIIKLAQEIIEQ